MSSENRMLDSGNKLFSWVAHDYHPHERGLVWYVMFSLIFFGGAVWAAFSDPKWGWVTSFSLCVVAAIYLFIHRDGDQDHEVQVFEKGLLIDDRRFIHWDKIQQFWFVYDRDVAIINFDLKKTPDTPIKLQMGQVDPEEFREALNRLIPEAEGKEESVFDLWVRVLKL